jgi:hypothetical protein
MRHGGASLAKSQISFLRWDLAKVKTQAGKRG